MEIDFKTGNVVRRIKPVERTLPYKQLEREDEVEQRLRGNGLYNGNPLIVIVDNNTGPDGKVIYLLMDIWM